MTENEPYPADKTPVFGLDELEPSPSRSQSQLNATGNADTISNRPCIALHDTLSQVRLTTDTFPVEIGNGRRFDMALTGPGPDGIYARIENNNGELTIERCHPSIFIAADNVEVSRYVLTGPVSFQLGDHLIDLTFAEKPVKATTRKRPRWILPIAFILIIAGALLFRLLLKADEAESRVSVVTRGQPTIEPAPMELSPAPEDTTTSTDFNSVPDTSAENETVSIATISDVKDTAPELIVLPSDISAFFTTSSLLPLPATRPPKEAVTEPILKNEAVRKQAKTQMRTPMSAPPQQADDNNANLIARYRQGHFLPSASGPPELQDALSAKRAYYNSETLDQKRVAWEALDEAEKSLGLTKPSRQSEEIRTALRASLLQAARQKEQKKEMRQAYELFYQAHSVGQSSEQGQRLMIALDVEAAQLYRFGYRLKYSAPITARHYWGQVISLVPPQSLWHRKASLALGSTKGISG